MQNGGIYLPQTNNTPQKQTTIIYGWLSQENKTPSKPAMLNSLTK